MAIMAGIVTVLIFFSSSILFVITTVSSLILLVVGIFVGIFYLIWESQQDRDRRKQKK